MAEGTGDIAYQSSDESIVTVSDGGTVKALAVGTANITATIEADDTYMAASVSYTVKVVSVSFPDPTVLSLIVGDVISHQATMAGADTLTYSSSDESIVTVTDDGAVTARAVGTAEITAIIESDDSTNAVSASYIVDVVNISFLESGVLSLIVGDTVSRPASLDGTGNLTYSSNDESIVTVTADGGTVTAISAGSAEITATITSNGLTGTASKAYQIVVVENEFTMTALVGVEDTLINVSEGIGGVDLYRSTEVNCDLDNWGACEDAGLDTIQEDAVIEDMAANFDRTAYYSFKHGNKITTTDVGGSLQKGAFSARWSHKIVKFKDKLWLIGGATSSGYNGKVHSDVWSSEDGFTWTQETNNAAFSGRRFHQVVVFNDKIWVIGGTTYSHHIYSAMKPNHYSNEVWNSENGVDWEQVDVVAGFSPRYGHQVVVADNKMWLIGGGTLEGSLRSNLYYSEDGSTWVKVNAPGTGAEVSKTWHQAVAAGGKLWVMGGVKSGWWANPSAEFWSYDYTSPNSSWVRESNFISSRAMHKMAVMGDKLWVIGGGTAYIGSDEQNDVWSYDYTVEGSNWVQENENAPFAARSGHEVIVIENEYMLLIGGTQKSLGYFIHELNDIWMFSEETGWRAPIHKTLKFN